MGIGNLAEMELPSSRRSSNNRPSMMRRNSSDLSSKSDSDGDSSGIEEQEELLDRPPSNNDGSISEDSQSSGVEESLATTDEDLPQSARANQESFEKATVFMSVICYFCYGLLVLYGYFRDFLRNVRIEHNPFSQELLSMKDFVPLYSDFDSLYTRNLFIRVRDCFNRPICSVPAAQVSIKDRVSYDYNWSFKFTGTETKALNLGSYNYLGFAQNRGFCADASAACIDKYGIAACSSKQETGSMRIQRELEQLMAEFLGTEDCIVFPMGFATNSLNIPTLVGKGCLILSDELNHASVILGCRLSGGTIRVFKHNNMEDLERKLQEAIVKGQKGNGEPFKKILIAIEGIYSMEGSIVRLAEIVALKKKYKAFLYLDEAHSIGALGDRRGRGVVEYWGVDPHDVDMLMGTYSKSFGSAGGYIAGAKSVISHLRMRSHSACYGSSMPPPVAQQILSTLLIIMGRDGTNEGQRRIQQLARNSRYFRQRLKQMGFIVYGNDDSPVVPLLMYLPTTIVYFTRQMLSRFQIAVVGAAFPATGLTVGRVRFCLSAAHTKQQLDKALEAVDVLGDEVGMKISKKKFRFGEVIEY